jgi:hypothetical protein
MFVLETRRQHNSDPPHTLRSGGRFATFLLRGALALVEAIGRDDGGVPPQGHPPGKHHEVSLARVQHWRGMAGGRQLAQRGPVHEGRQWEGDGS